MLKLIESQLLKRRTKGQLYYTVLPAVLCGFERWTVSKAREAIVAGFERNSLRRIYVIIRNYIVYLII
jgi:hypothetical protein